MRKFKVGGKWKVEGGNNLSASRLPPSTARSASFTLIEMIGVMAIIGILAAVVLPPMIARIEDAQTTNEDANLEEIARALLAGIKAEGRIPNPNVDPTNPQGWAAMATNYSILGTNAVVYSVPQSASDTVRRYYLSPQLLTFLNGSYTNGSTWSTSTFPSAAFFMLVSVSKENLRFANTMKTNLNLSSNNILWLQNWAKTYNTTGRVLVDNLDVVGNIDGTTNPWTNRGQFLHVKIVNLRSLFSRVSLEDWHSPITNWTLSSPHADAPSSSTPNPIIINGLHFSWTGVKWNLINQPSQNLAANFDKTVSGTRNALEIEYDNTETPSPKKKTIAAFLPAGPYFSINSSTRINITDFSPSRANAFDSTNFYAMQGTVIKLWDNQSAPTVQKTVRLNKESYDFVFSSGIWRDLME